MVMPNQDDYLVANHLSHSRWVHPLSGISSAWHSTWKGQPQDAKSTNFPSQLLLIKAASLPCEKSIWVCPDARNGATGTAPCTLSIRRSGKRSRHRIRCTTHTSQPSSLGWRRRSEDICEILGPRKKLERGSSMYVTVDDLYNCFDTYC